MYFIIVMIFSPISAVNEDADHPYLVSSFDSNQMINQRGGWSEGIISENGRRGNGGGGGGGDGERRRLQNRGGGYGSSDRYWR